MMAGSSLLLFGMVATWVTPLWLVSLGVAVGVAVLAALFGVAYAVSRPLAAAIVTSIREGILLSIFYLAMFLTAFAAFGVFLVPAIPARALLTSASRIASVGPADYEFEVPASTREFELKSLQIPLSELRDFTVDADQPVNVSTNIFAALGTFLNLKVVPGTQSNWKMPFKAEKDQSNLKYPTEFKVTNVNAEPAKLRIHAERDVEFPEVRVVPATAVSLIALVLIYLAVQLACPKISAIAVTTAKEAMSQPLFYVVLAGGAFFLLGYVFIPYNTFGEDVKMLKDSGLTTILVLSILVAVWSASVSVAEEVEGRTVLTVLSKPVRRWQFILGKFFGVLGPVVVLFIVLGVLFLATVSYKVVYDSREVAKAEPSWQLCYLEMIRIVPGLVLAFLETVVLAAISVAISTRLPMLANLIVCAVIYALGHLVPLLVNSSVGKFEIVRFVGQFLATVLPVLDHFNIQAAVAAGAAVPISYLGMALVYCVLYSSIAMLLGLVMFEDRDLA